MPDFIRASGDFTHPFRQTIVRVREHENTPDLLGGLVEVRDIWFQGRYYSRRKAEARGRRYY